MVYKLIPNTNYQLHNITKIWDFNDPPSDIHFILKKMKETMIKCRGVGLSMNQIEALDCNDNLIESYKILVMGNPDDKLSILSFINPKIVDSSEETIRMDEGCLSYPGITLPIKRPKSVRIRYDDENGKTQTVKLDGMSARIIQHEIDHLDGIVFLSKSSRYHLDRAKNQLKRINRLKKTRII